MHDSIILDGRLIALSRHTTDFVVLRGSEQPQRVRAARDRDAEMDQIRRAGGVAYHVYRTDEGEELAFDDMVEVRLRDEQAADRIAEQFGLVHIDSIGPIHRFRVTAATGVNPLKAANRLADLAHVESAQPRLVIRPESSPRAVARARLTRSQARKAVNDSIRAVSGSEVDDRTKPLRRFGISNGPRLDSFKAELCNPPNGVPQFPGFELDPDSLRSITTETAVEATDDTVQQNARDEG
jgi:hypothetical protein